MELKGKYNVAKVFATTIGNGAIEQIKRVCDSEWYADSRIRIMPDVHAGKGCTIGTTMTIRQCVCPNMVGVDIGCGMETVRLSAKEIDFVKLDELIRREIPFGREIRSTKHVFADEIDLNELKCAKDVAIERAERSIGSLGGGNHFIEVDVDEDGAYYLVVHSGSRHLGTEVCAYYQLLAYQILCGNDPDSIRRLIEEYKSQGRDKEIQQAIKDLKAKEGEIDKNEAYLTGQAFSDYIDDMKITQRFAMLNRKAMVSTILQGMGWTAEDSFTTIHNYIDTDHMVLRKGAVAAYTGQKLLIPINMKEGSLVCIGKGNEDWNCSAPHGAGRLFSRIEARRRFSMEDYVKTMEGVFSTCVNASTIDESPMAYKNSEDLLRDIEPTVTIINKLKPVYNFKAEE